MIFSSLLLADIPIVVLRDDLNHSVVSGNKLHKLEPNIKLAYENNCSTIVSFGGPYSNHLHALAWACKNEGLKSIGVVRGELQDQLTPTLKDCLKWGMTLFPCSRKDYRAYQTLLINSDSPCFADQGHVQSLANELKLDHPKQTLIIPEGGSNTLAIESLSNAYKKVLNQSECAGVTHVICSTGTGATLAGILNASPKKIAVIGVQAVAEGDATLKRIEQWQGQQAENLRIVPGHLGGFGKIPKELVSFINNFETEFNIPLDPVYNSKAMLKLSQMIDDSLFKKTDKILFIHTGGLQGKKR